MDEIFDAGRCQRQDCIVENSRHTRMRQHAIEKSKCGHIFISLWQAILVLEIKIC